MINKVIPFVHDFALKHINKIHIAVDMTCGNGNDTLLLGKLSKHVHAFDIQEIALSNTKKLLDDNSVSNYTLHHISHEFINKTAIDNVDFVIYNLGYLPNGDKEITTLADSTRKSLTDVLSILNINGYICITVYIGHKNGKIEDDELMSFISSLSSSKYNILQYKFLNKNNSPYTIIIEKVR